MQRARLPYLLIPLAAFLAILPLLTKGSSCGHDFDFHLLSWFEAARQFTHGNLHPHWAYTAAYNAGEPRFVFYPPLSWTFGAILGLLFPWQWTPIIYTWLALTASGLAAHYLVRDFTTPLAATLAAVLYTVNPYMLFTAYERTAYAELLAAAFIPLLLQAILSSQVTIPRIAIPIALLWLTNAPAAVMSCYALALLTVIRLVTNSSNQLPPVASNDPIDINPGVTNSSNRFPPVASNNRSTTNPSAPYLDSEMWASRESGSPSSVFARRGEEGATAPAHSNVTTTPTQTPLQLALNTLAGTTLGLGLAAFYILPAAYERRYVQIAMAIIPNMRIQDNFLFHRTGDPPHDQVLHTASLLAVILITATVIALTTLRLTNKARVPHPSRPYREGWDEETSTRQVPHSSQQHREPGSPACAFARWGGEGWDVQMSPNILLPLTILTITITLLLTPLTTFIWNRVPELAFLQFPWRLTAIVAAVLAFTIALALRSFHLKPTTAALTLAIAAALTFPAYTAFHQSCDEEDTVQARLTLFHSNHGAEPTDEYTPIDADNDSLATNNPPYWRAPEPDAKAPSNAQPGPAPTHLTLNSSTPEDLILNLRDYPSWRITLNETPIITHLQRDDGLIAIPIPAGPSTIDITYTHAIDQTIGNILSVISLALLSILVLRKQGHRHL